MQKSRGFRRNGWNALLIHDLEDIKIAAEFSNDAQMGREFLDGNILDIAGPIRGRNPFEYQLSVSVVYRNPVEAVGDESDIFLEDIFGDLPLFEVFIEELPVVADAVEIDDLPLGHKRERPRPKRPEKFVLRKIFFGPNRGITPCDIGT